MTMMILKGDGSCQGHPDPRYLKYLEKKGKFFLPNLLLALALARDSLVLFRYYAIMHDWENIATGETSQAITP